jgi:hypothetical protein
MSCTRRNERYLESNRAPSSPRGMTMLSRSRIISNFVFSMLGDRSIRKRPFDRCVKKQALTSPTPECAECEPYYNSTNWILVARSYLDFRGAVKKKKCDFPWQNEDVKLRSGNSISVEFIPGIGCKNSVTVLQADEPEPVRMWT